MVIEFVIMKYLTKPEVTTIYQKFALFIIFDSFQSAMHTFQLSFVKNKKTKSAEFENPLLPNNCAFEKSIKRYECCNPAAVLLGHLLFAAHRPCSFRATTTF